MKIQEEIEKTLKKDENTIGAYDIIRIKNTAALFKVISCLASGNYLCQRLSTYQTRIVYRQDALLVKKHNI